MTDVKISGAIPVLQDISRLEVITPEGREFVRNFIISIEVSLQDGGKTLKVFVS